MTDDIGGIRSEVTLDASSALSVLQRIEQAYRQFDSRFAVINTKVTATAPTAAQLREIRTQIITGIGTIEVPVKLMPPTGQQAAAQIARPAAAPAAVAAEPDQHAAAIDRANATGQRVQYRTSGGSIATAYPTSGGGPVGGGSGLSVGGVPLPPGARGFAAPGGGGGYDIPRLQEQAARASQLEEQLRSLRAQVESGTVVNRRNALPAGVIDDPRLQGPGLRGPGGRIISAAQAQALAEEQNRTQIRRPPAAAPSVAAEARYVPPPSSDLSEREQLLRAATGEFGPAAQAEAEAQLPDVGSFRRKRPPSTTPSRTRRVGIEERGQLTESTPELELGTESRLASQQRLIEARQLNTVRATGTFAAGGLSILFGGGQARELQAQAAAAVSEQGRLEKLLFSARAKERDIEVAYQNAQPSQRRQIRDDLNTQREVVEEVGNQYLVAADQATELTKAARAAANPIRNLAAGFVGGIAGSLAFAAGMQVISGAAELAGKAIGPVIERLTGYQNVASKLTSTLSDQARQQNGLADIATTQALAQTNLNATTAASIQPIIAQRTAVETGNKAISDQLDIFNSSLAIQRQNQSFGGDKGLFQTTGGLNILGKETPLFGTPSTQELIARQISQPGQTAAGRISSEINPVVNPGGAFDFASKLLNPNNLFDQDALKQTLLDTFSTPLEDAAKEAASGLQYLNNQLDKGGEHVLRFSTGLAEGAERTRQANLLQQAGASDLAGVVRQGLVSITGLSTEADVGRVLQAYNQGGQKPDLQLLIEAQKPQIEAQRALFREQAETQRRLFLPAAFAFQQSVSPTTAFGTGFTRAPAALGGRALPTPFGPQGTAGNIGGEDRFGQAFGALAPLISKVDDQLVGLRAKGQAALEALVPREQLTAFKALQDQIQGIGDTIAGLQAGVQQQQVNLQVAQYNDQLRVARRSEQDLLQLTGQIGATQGDNLGALQRTVILEQRHSQELQLQSNELSLQLAQRQINFRLAVAGFTAPGTTPQERAARIEQAKIEAEFAQKQLDIQKEQQGIASRTLPISFEIQDTGFERQLTDVEAQIALINQGIAVTVNTAAAQQAIEHLQKLEGELAKEAQTYIEEGTKVISAYQSAAAQLKAETAAGFNTVLTQTAQAWGVFLQQGSTAVSGLTGGGGTIPTPGGRGVNTGLTPNTLQTGYFGNVGQATNITVGEAGNETVAVLRNPREVMGSMGGGTAISIKIEINNPVVREDQDIEKLAALVATQVEDRIGRKASTYGFGAGR